MKLKLNRNWAILGVAGLVGIVAAVSVQRYIQHRVQAAGPAPNDAPTVGVVVASGTLTPGTPLSRSNVAVRQVPREWVHTNAIRPNQFGTAENMRLVVGAAAGEPILWAQLDGDKTARFSALLASGRRAVTVPVDEVSSISGMLEPGDSIDLIVSMRQGGKVKLLPVMQDVRVLATGTQVQPASGKTADDGRHAKASASFTTVTLDATPQDARRIMAAREVGKVTALLRAPGDTALQESRIDEAYALLGMGRQASGRPPVQVLYGGRSTQAVRPLPAQHHDDAVPTFATSAAPSPQDAQIPQ